MMVFDLTQFKKELHDLLAKHKVWIGAEIEGDTHGITENFVVSHKNETHILAHYQSTISASDLKEKGV